MTEQNPKQNEIIYQPPNILPLLTLLLVLLLLLLVGLVEVFTASSLQVLVVRLPLADVTQHRVRLLQLRELAVGLRLVRVSVGMLQLRLRQVRALDLSWTRVPTHTELEVVILLGNILTSYRSRLNPQDTWLNQFNFCKIFMDVS